jgi:type VI secretion system protein ImpL
VIYILFGLFIGLTWAVFFVLQWPWWIAAIITGVVVLVALIFGGIRAIRARRKAKALEKALFEQGKQQEMNARPEKRAEIQALQKQINDGISSLKTSKVGGKARGITALYTLPWYAIVGPPGAGKTTALRHSGLVFPYADTAIKGVGGTRNCDWWFTNEAIILDTAGRYTTEAEDQQEWFAFLDLLRKYRTGKPLNGLIVAVSITDVVDANEAQLESMGKKLRARIDEVMTRLRIVLPVYFLLTKCDLIAGFSEFHGGLRKSERAQAWGATISLKEDKADPAGIFAREFDLLVQEIHARACKRMNSERNRQAREAIFQFPIELAGIKRNLQDLIAQVFAPNPFQGTPVFRGFYFSSGTQEGLPLNRVLQRMGQAMGINTPQMAQQPKVESKSYFIHDVFMKVVFPDANVAARSASEVRRQRLVRLAVAATAMAVALVICLPSINSFMNNQELLASSKSKAQKAAKIDWEDGAAISQKFDQLDPLLERIKKLDEYKDDVPFGYRFLMYSGDEVHVPLGHVYVANMQQGMVKTTKYSLERELKDVNGERYFAEREKLKQYLMLSDVEHLDIEYATGKFTALWADSLKSTSDLGVSALKKRMRPHVEYYFSLIKPEGNVVDETLGPRKAKLRFDPVPANEKILEHARGVLQSVAVPKRYLSLFVDALEYDLYNPAEDKVRSNQQFPPFTLEALFSDRLEVLQIITSKEFEKTKKYYEVPGPYTDKGHYAVLQNIENAAALLESEQWVVPLSNEERIPRLHTNVKRLADDYEQGYINYWKDFFLDLKVKQPATLKEAIALYAELQNPEWPYARLIRALEDHTQWKKDFGALDNKAGQQIVNRRLNAYLSTRAQGLRFNVDIKKIAGRATRVPPAFLKTVGFGAPEGKASLTETQLNAYMEILARISKKMVDILDKNKDAGVNDIVIDLQKAVEECEKLLAARDDMAKRLLLPLLQFPLNVGGSVKMTNPLLAPDASP